jgi:hypothetical protein
MIQHFEYGENTAVLAPREDRERALADRGQDHVGRQDLMRLAEPAQA